MQRRGLERPDGGVVELAGHVARECSGPGAERSGRRRRPAPRHPLGDQRVDRRGGQAVRLDGLEVQDLRAPAARRDAPTVPRSRSASSQPFPRQSVVGLVHQLAPDVGAHVLERPGIPDPRRHLVLHVVVAQRDVAPLGRGQLPQAEQRAAVLGRAPVEGEDAFHLAVQHQHLVPLGALRPEHGARPRRPAPGAARRARTRSRAGIHQPARLVGRRRRPRAPRTAGGSSRSRWSAGCRDCRRSERSGRPGSASRRRWNWRNAKTIAALVGRTEWKRSPAMTTASGRAAITPSIASAEGLGDVGLALIDAGGGLPVVLPDAEVRVGDMGEFHVKCLAIAGLSKEFGRPFRLLGLRNRSRRRRACTAGTPRRGADDLAARRAGPGRRRRRRARRPGARGGWRRAPGARPPPAGRRSARAPRRR